MRKLFITLVSLLSLSGCAYQGIHPGQIIGEMFTGLKGKKVVINVNLPTQGIVYTETQYRVLWLNYQDGRAKYDAVWPTARSEMESELIQSFKNIEVDPQTEIESEGYRKFYYSHFKSMPKQHNVGHSPHFSGPTMKSYNALYETDEFRQYAESLKNKGYEFLVDITITDIRASSQTFSKGLMIRSQFNVIDIKTGEIVGKRFNYGFLDLPSDIGLGDLHKNKMAAVKNAVLPSLRNTFNGERHWFWNAEK